MYVDKALRDYLQHAHGQCETHWRDLIVSNLEQQIVELLHPTTDLSRTEQVESEQRVALDIYLSYRTRAERVEAWVTRTGKSQAAMYRRLKELRAAGRLPDDDRMAG